MAGSRKKILTRFTLALGAVILLFAATAEAQIIKRPEVPFRTDAGLITAEYYLANGKYMQAIDVLGGVLQRHPENADAYAYRGFAYQQMNEFKKAAQEYARALAIDPTHLGANKYVATMYLQAGSLARAMEQLQAIKLICAGTPCAEMDELESEINQFKRTGKTPKEKK